MRLALHRGTGETMDDPLRLYGLKALVINAGGGIGEAVCRTLVKHGANVLAVDRVGSGVKARFDHVDGIEGFTAALTNAAELPAVVDEAVKRLGDLDIIVADFPLRPSEPISDGDAQLARMLGARRELASALATAAIPRLKRSPGGRIVNIGFVRSVFAEDGERAYRESEADLAALTADLAAETGKFGITATYIQPGAIMTPDARDVFRKDIDLRDFCIRQSAAKRLGDPVDIAKVALFLASSESAFVSGTGIRADGGYDGS
jgi:NAD(P)-dependent dehydrogenase (short-subunit alcohol dehydrogenase family)